MKVDEEIAALCERVSSLERQLQRLEEKFVSMGDKFYSELSCWNYELGSLGQDLLEIAAADSQEGRKK